MIKASRATLMVLLLCVAFGSPALAQDGPIAKAVGKDLECYHRWLKMVHALIVEDTTGTWGKHCRGHHVWGLDAHRKARAAYDSGRYLQAYTQLYEAKARLQPCFGRIFTEKKLSQETKDIIRLETVILADNLAATKAFIETAVKDRNKSIKAAKTYNAAKADWDMAKKYDSLGKHVQARKSVLSAQKKLHQAIIIQLQYLKATH